MNEILRLFFLQLNTDPGHGWWYDFLKDYAFPLLFAGGAAFMAWWIFIKESNRDKRKEEEKQHKEYEDKLVYLSSLVDNSLKIIVKQNMHIDLYLEESKSATLDNPILTILMLNPLRIVSEDLNREHFLIPFVNRYSKNRRQSVLNFLNLFNGFDFLYRSYTMIKDADDKQKEITKSIKEQLKTQYVQAQNQLHLTLGYLLKSNKGIYDELNKIWMNFRIRSQQKMETDVIFDMFFEPVFQLCKSLISKSSDTDETISKLFDMTQTAMHLKIELELAVSNVIKYVTALGPDLAKAERDSLIVTGEFLEDFKM